MARDWVQSAIRVSKEPFSDACAVRAAWGFYGFDGLRKIEPFVEGEKFCIRGG